MGKQTLVRHGFLAVVLGLSGAVSCGDSDSDAEETQADGDSDATAGEDDGTTGSGNAEDAGNTETGSKDIVDTAVAAGNFTMLAGALGKTGLVDALKGD